MNTIYRYTTLGVLLFFTASCGHLLYQPTSQLYYPPEKLNLKHEDIAIPVEGATKVHAWLFKAEKQPSKGMLIFFHGNAQNLTAHYAALAWIVKEGYDFLIWDYRGYGISDGEPTPENTVKDGVKVIEYAYTRFPEKPLFVFGQSLGGAIALRSVIELKDKSKLKGVIVDSTFQSYKAVSRSVLSKNWITWVFQPIAYLVISDEWAPKNKIAEISPLPLVIMHGTDDPIVSFQFGKEIFEYAKEPKYFWPIEGGTHTDSFFVQSYIYRKKLLTFLGTPYLSVSQVR